MFTLTDLHGRLELDGTFLDDKSTVLVLLSMRRRGKM